MTQNMNQLRRAAAGGSLAVAACLLVAGCAQTTPSPRTSQQTTQAAPGGTVTVDNALAPPVASSSATQSGANGGKANFVREVAAKVEPCVVTVHTLANIQRQPMNLQDMMLGGGGGMEVRRGAGSGVIISSDGYILTNNHVVAGAQQVTVLVNGTGYQARVIGVDALTDIAVVKINVPASVTLPVAHLGDSDSVQVGDWAIAVGDPLDIGATVTLGIISAIGNRGPRLQGDMNSTVLQTDAAINPGNSGGALANSDGQVIGINEAIASPTGSSIGIGFAIPINSARQVAQQLIAHGRVIRPYLGISYAPVKSVPPQVRTQAGIDPSLTSGDVVAMVAPGTPAASVLQPGDVILSIDGQSLDDKDALNKIVGADKVGDTIKLQIQRQGKTLTVPVTLRERPAAYGVPPGGQEP